MEIPENIQHQLNQFQQLQQQAKFQIHARLKMLKFRFKKGTALEELTKLMKMLKFLNKLETYLLKLIMHKQLKI